MSLPVRELAGCMPLDFCFLFLLFLFLFHERLPSPCPGGCQGYRQAQLFKGRPARGNVSQGYGSEPKKARTQVWEKVRAREPSQAGMAGTITGEAWDDAFSFHPGNPQCLIHHHALCKGHGGSACVWWVPSLRPQGRSEKENRIGSH